MKVVLFCGGFGMRLREYSDAIPKPMVPIGYRPILWHIMKYYAHFGHKDFILCLGWKADVFKQYFLNYDECGSNDFVLSRGGRDVQLLASDIEDWRITFVDTGVNANIGQRLKAVEPHVRGEPTFLANYADGLSDVHLPSLIRFHEERKSVATFAAVRPTQSFHAVHMDGAGSVQNITAINQADVWMNAGFFVLDHAIFDYMEAGDELVVQPFQRLINEGRLASMKHEGFYGCMDTFKEKQTLDEMWSKGQRPWALWEKAAATDPHLVPGHLRQQLDAIAPPAEANGLVTRGIKAAPRA